MTHRALALILAASCVASAAAAPTLENMKAESGMRFSETLGLGNVKPEAEPVWAGKTPGRRANLAVQPTAPSPKPDAPPSPTPPAPKAPGSSLGTKLLVGGGYLAGAIATAVLGPKVLAVLAIGGGVAAGVTAWRNHESAWSIVKKTATGAALGAASIAIVGAGAGLAIGRTLERFFKR